MTSVVGLAQLHATLVIVHLALMGWFLPASKAAALRLRVLVSISLLASMLLHTSAVAVWTSDHVSTAAHFTQTAVRVIWVCIFQGTTASIAAHYVSTQRRGMVKKLVVLGPVLASFCVFCS